ncbi:MAG: DUF423 domain-containing protein [Sneathiella sp.]|nr:DUF423 domain-containing protein [Sneathiella sp.]
MRIPWLMIAALLGAVTVVMGAAGSHSLSGNEGALKLHHTAQTYLMFHIPALMTVWVFTRLTNVSIVLANCAGIFFLAGTLFFSGSLHYLSQTGDPLIPFATPLGGVSFILGWTMLAFCGFQEWRGVKN